GQPSPALVAVAPPASSPRPALPLPAATAAAVNTANASRRAGCSALWRMRAASSAPASLALAPALLLFEPCNPAARARADAYVSDLSSRAAQHCAARSPMTNEELPRRVIIQPGFL